MLSHLQELALITRCIAADDRDAFGVLVDEYSDDIRRLLLRLTGGDVPLVDDLAQDTFLKAWLSIRSFNALARFRTWVYRIAYNEFVSHARRRAAAGEIDETLADTLADDTEPDAPVSTEDLEAAIARLSERERAVVQLFYYDGFSVGRVSEITGMPQNTVKVYLHRARTRLARFLEPLREN
ncbi:MAG: sigma-70 family RNA polymerase sigma factor [Clostridium sp.]|nr:sigma-70 family RNA polymerase sigma factor [Clostridium sp.]